MNFISKYWKLLSIFLLFLILFPIGLFGLKGFDTKMVPPIPPTSTPQPARTSDNQLSPVESTYPTIDQTSDPEKRLIDKVANRVPLSAQDRQARNKLLTIDQSQTGSIYETSAYTIEYIQSPDLFKVEIMTPDITSAKKQAVQWFISKGFTLQGLCDLPLSFYLNFDIAKQYRDGQVKFNPLPEGC
jgi:hypothetical protein